MIQTLNGGDDKEKRTPKNRAGCVLMLVLGGLAFGLCAQYVLIPFFITGGGNVDTQPVPGDATHFDPIASYAEIAAYAGEGAQLIELSAYFVRSDGTLDLTADYYPRVTYDFAREVPRPDDAPPVGAGGSAGGKWYERIEIEAYQPNQWRRVSGTHNYTYMNRGMEREVSSPQTLSASFIPPPACSFADLWETAMTRDAPDDAVAIIEYDAEGYDFRISDVSIRLEFDSDCQLVD